MYLLVLKGKLYNPLFIFTRIIKTDFQKYYAILRKDFFHLNLMILIDLELPMNSY